MGQSALHVKESYQINVHHRALVMVLVTVAALITVQALAHALPVGSHLPAKNAS